MQKSIDEPTYTVLSAEEHALVLRKARPELGMMEIARIAGLEYWRVLEIFAPNGTRARVMNLATTKPHLIAADIARLVGVSRERVGQILRQYGFPTKRYGIQYIIMRCSICGTKLRRKASAVRAMRKRSEAAGILYSPRCTRHILTLTCAKCGKSFQRAMRVANDYLRRRKYPERQHRVWCSKTCKFQKQLGTGGIHEGGTSKQSWP